MDHRLFSLAFSIALASGVAGCSTQDGVSTETDDFSSKQRLSGLKAIHDEALAAGITQGWLIAGIANHETHLVQCWKDWQLPCRGPTSAECGGPVLIGSGDETCNAGGVGMFQLDNGSFGKTIDDYRRIGMDLLTLRGNARAGITILLEKFSICQGLEPHAAKRFLNDIVFGDSRYVEYLGLLSECYNGQRRGTAGWEERKNDYNLGIKGVLSMVPASWWSEP